MSNGNDERADVPILFGSGNHILREQRQFIVQGELGILDAAHDSTYSGKSILCEVFDEQPDKVGPNLSVWVQPNAADLNAAEAQAADIIICSSPKLLPGWAKAKHVFPDHPGVVRILPVILTVRDGKSYVDVPGIYVQAMLCNSQYVSQEDAAKHLFFGGPVGKTLEQECRSVLGTELSEILNSADEQPECAPEPERVSLQGFMFRGNRPFPDPDALHEVWKGKDDL